MRGEDIGLFVCGRAVVRELVEMVTVAANKLPGLFETNAAAATCGR